MKLDQQLQQLDSAEQRLKHIQDLIAQKEASAALYSGTDAPGQITLYEAPPARAPVRAWVDTSFLPQGGLGFAERRLYIASESAGPGSPALMTYATLHDDPRMAEANVRYAIQSFCRQSHVAEPLVREIVTRALGVPYQSVAMHMQADALREQKAKEKKYAQLLEASSRQREWDAVTAAFADDGDLIDYEAAAPLRQAYIDKYGVDPLDEPRPGGTVTASVPRGKKPGELEAPPRPFPLLTIGTFTMGAALLAYQLIAGVGEPSLMVMAAGLMGVSRFFTAP